MPRHRQPTPLLKLCVSAVAKKIISQGENLREESHGSTMLANLEVARQEYVSSLPGTVRALLLEEVGRLLSLDSYPSESLGALNNISAEMLFGPDVQHLHVKQRCPHDYSHLAATLALIGQEGAGLKTLKLDMPHSPLLLEQALTRPASLKQLYLPRNCRDVHLQIISSTCPNLSVLDVSESKYVTDYGLRFLFFRTKYPFMEYVDGPRDAHCCLNPSCGNRDCRRIRLLFKLFTWMQSCGERYGEAERLHHILHYWSDETDLCGSLSELDIGYTNVTPIGALLAFMKAPQLRSFGSYKQAGRALEVFDSCWREVYQNRLIDLPTFCLNSVHTDEITEPQLILINKYLPGLRLLSLYFPKVDHSALTFLPRDLKVLRILNNNFNGQWATGLYSLGNTFLGSCLQHLSLSCLLGERTELNLYDLFQSCPNLITFRGKGTHMNWVKNMSGRDLSMPHLRSLIVGEVVARNVVVEALRRCPNLEVANFEKCLDLTDGDIMRATYTLLEHLKCFYVSVAPRLTEKTVSAIQTACKNISKIGDVNRWGISNAELLNIKRKILENNWDLQLTDWRHGLRGCCETSSWFSNTPICFQNTSNLNFS